MAVETQTPSAADPVGQTRMHALVLDRDSGDCAATMDYLRGAGYETLAAASLGEARDALARSTFDLMLLDLRLDDSNSLPLCAEIRERFGDDPIVIFLSNDGTPAQRILSLDLGADDVMGKPYDGEELLARISARRRRRTQAPH
jgi:two-component system, OmpR family, phosphate regulon response regulator OmpR